MYPYIPGASTRTFKPVPSPTRENEKAYERRQEQRALERAIRKSRREVAAMEALGERARSGRRRRSSREGATRMNQFIDESGRARRLDRERIF
jgi:hypothetical protein